MGQPAQKQLCCRMIKRPLADGIKPPPCARHYDQSAGTGARALLLWSFQWAAPLPSTPNSQGQKAGLQVRPSSLTLPFRERGSEFPRRRRDVASAGNLTTCRSGARHGASAAEIRPASSQQVGGGRPGTGSREKWPSPGHQAKQAGKTSAHPPHIWIPLFVCFLASSHFVLPAVLCSLADHLDYPHFMDEKIKVQRGYRFYLIHS